MKLNARWTPRLARKGRATGTQEKRVTTMKITKVSAKNFIRHFAPFCIGIVIVVLGLLIMPRDANLAETNYTFVQTSWTGGASANVAVHPTDRTGWTRYSSKDANIDASGGQLKISTSTGSNVLDTDTDFASGTLTRTIVSGTGASAKVTLESTLDDPFVTAPQQWNTAVNGNSLFFPKMNHWSMLIKAGDYVYCNMAYNYFARMNVTTHKWQFLTRPPKNFGPGSCLAYPGSGNYIYATMGGGTKDFLRYDTVNNTWSAMASTPYYIDGGSWIVGVSYDNKIYCLYGSGAPTRYEFGRYDIATNAWSSDLMNANYTSDRGHYNSQLIYPGSGSYIYHLRGQSSNIERYSITSNVWNTFSDGSSCYRDGWYGGGGSYLDGYIYTWRGVGYSDFWRMNVTTQSWENLGGTDGLKAMEFYTDGPCLLYDPGVGSSDYEFLMGRRSWATPMKLNKTTLRWNWVLARQPVTGSYQDNMVYPGSGDYIYYVPSNYSPTRMYQYSISNKAWTRLNDGPSAWSYSRFYGSKQIEHYNNKIYIVNSYNGSFGYYNIGAGTYTTLTSPPATPSNGAAIKAVSYSGTNYLYMLRGGNTTSFYRYNLAQSEPGSWETLGTAPQTVEYGAGLAYPGSGNYLYAARGNRDTRFWRFNLQTQAWDSDTAIAWKEEATESRSGQLFCIPGKTDYVYYFVPYYSDDYGHIGVERYTISTNTWEWIDGPEVPNNEDGCIAVSSSTIYYWARDYGSQTATVNANGTLTWAAGGNYFPAGGRYGSSVEVGNNIYLFMYDYYGADIGFIFSKTTLDFTGTFIPPFKMHFGCKATYPGSGNYIYVTQGGGSYKFWRYDYVNDSWTQMANTPQANYTSRTALEAYGTDSIYAYFGRYSEYLFKYTISTNTWSAQGDIPQNPSAYDNGCPGRPLIGMPSKGGLYWISNNRQSLYFYEVGSNSWLTLTNNSTPPGYGSTTGCSFYYPGSGNYLYFFNYDRYFYRLDMSDNTWTTLKECFYAPQAEPMIFSSGDIIYLFASSNSADYIHLRKYSISNDVWDWNSFWYLYHTDLNRTKMVADPDYNRAYYAYNSATFRRMDLDTELTDVLDDNGDTYVGYAPVWVTAPNNRNIYAIYGRNSTAFRKYSIDDNSWSTLASLPSAMPTYGGMCGASDGTYIYVAQGGNLTGFWRYNIAGDTWSSTYGTVPVAVYNGSGMCYAKGYVYLLVGNQNNAFYRVDVSGASAVFSARTSAPFLAGGAAGNTEYGESALFYPGIGDYIYAYPCNSDRQEEDDARFYRYKISTNAWEEIQSAPYELRRRPQLIRFKDSDYIYAQPAVYYYYSCYKPQVFYLWKSGTYTSPVITVGDNKEYGTMTWSDNGLGEIIVKARTADNASMSGATAWDDCSEITKGSDLSGYSSVTDGHKYIQYKFYLYGYAAAQFPQIESVTVNYLYYPTAQTLISSVYNTTEATNRILKLSWSETIPGATDLRFQLRTSADGTNWSNWLGPTGTNTFTNDFSTVGDYSKSTKVKVSGGYALLMKDLEDYQYKQAISLDNTGGSLRTNSVIQVTLTSANTSFWAHVQSDGDDIRFYDPANSQKCGYYLSNFDYSNQTAVINFEVASIPADTVKTVYLLYGSSSAVSESDISVCSVPQSGLVGWWKFDEGTGITAADSSGNNNTGTLANGPLWVTSQAGHGYALSFDGSNDYVDIQDSASLRMTNAFTLAAWVKIPSTGYSSRNAIIDKHYQEYELNLDSSGTVFLIYKGDGGTYGGYESHSYNYDFRDNNWHHICFTIDGTSSVYYIDGASVHTYTWPHAGTQYSTNSLNIARRPDGSCYTKGLIDDVVVYNRALNLTEVQLLGTGASFDGTVTVSGTETANAYTLTTYYTDNPVIQPVTGVSYNNDLASFQAVATQPSGSAIKYQVSDNGYEWYYYTGSVWAAVTGGYTQTNTATQINTNLATFMSSVATSGEFYYRAYLHSDSGTATPQLDQVTIALATSNTYYLDNTGATAINALHSDATSDQYYQYKVILYSNGKDTPILNDLTMEYLNAYVTVTSPDGSEIWSIGTPHNITWNEQAIGETSETVKIEYSTDGGSSWKSEATAATNNGSYAWTVDDDHTAQARVKITSNTFPVITDMSNANFRIVGSVTVTAPNTGNERWVTGTTHDITWTSTGTMPNVKIEYSRNNGSTWANVIESEGTENDGIVANDGTFTWTIPDEITTTNSCLVRVSDSVDADTKDVSDAAFRIIGELGVTYPTSGANLVSWATYNVTWTTTGSIGQVDLEYSVDGGTVWMDMAGNAGQVTTVTNEDSYSWYVPNPLSENALLRVKDHSDSTVYSISPSFNIRGFQLSTPNGAEQWEVGYTHSISWTSGGVIETPIVIWLSQDGGVTYLPNPITTRYTNTGSYDWNIFEAQYSPSNTCIIKIVDAGGRQDVSNANFKIMPHPVITVTAPVVSDEWIIGTGSHNITWTTTGDVSSDLIIEYSINSGNWTAVDPAPTPQQITNKSYSWTAVDPSSALPANVQFRVRESAAPQGRDTQTAVVGTSATAKIITPTITITAPTSGTTWVAGDTSRTITWTHVGTLLDNLTLEYSVDAGTTWNLIESFTQAAHDGTYNWQNLPAEAVGESVLLRIRDARTPVAVSDESDAITILGHQKITLTHPTPGEMLIQGDGYNITWDWDGQATSSTLKLQMSTDGGLTWPEYPPYYIDNQIPNSPSSYYWVVPEVDTTTAQIRIYDVNDALVTSTTENFTITIPQVSITAPAAGNQWYATGTYNITWSTIGWVSNSLKLEYQLSSDGGTTWGSWQTITAATTAPEAAAKAKAWTIPDSVGSTARVRITDNNRVAVTDISDNFTIIAPTIAIATPTGAETGANAWVVGTQHSISWTTTGGASGAIKALKIQYTTNGTSFTDVTTITNQATLAADAGSYSWTIPNAVSTTVRVKIFDPERTATTNTSNQFEIKAPSITVTSPNTGSESWIIGTQHEVTWYSVGTITEPLKMYYTANGSVWVQITAFDGTNDGSYMWTVPDAYSAGLAKIKIEDSYTPTAHVDTSDASFTIALPTIAVTTPAELWSATATKTVNWTPTGTLLGPNMKVEWSLDNFATAGNVISQTVPKENTSVDWTVPEAAVGTTVRLRVTDLGRTLVWGKSNEFTVLPVPVITVSSPDATQVGDDALRIGKEYTIAWSDNGGAVSNDLKLQYTTDGGTSWTDIATGEANDGTYAWTVPLTAEASTTAKVRIYDNVPWKTGTNLTAESATFDIAIPRITITSPVTGTIWAAGDSAPVTWTSDGYINDNLTIQYTYDGTNYLPVAAGQTNDGSYTWTVPDVVTSVAKIKIIDASSNYGGEQVIATSDAFSIISNPTLTVTAPNGNEVYVLGDTLPITWTSQGLQIENVKIEYSSDNFTSTIRTIIDSTPNTGSYNWTIPETALSGSTIKVRVSMVGNPSIKDVSDVTFRIRGGFTITSPVAAERRIVGKSETFTWTTRGTIGNVKVLYSSTGAEPWTTITNSVTNSDTYSFALPEPRSTTAKVRIEDATDNSVYAESPTFNADYYTITWRVLDYDTNAPLQLLSVRDAVWVDQDKSITAPIDHDYPYAAYTTFWSKDGYIERATEWTCDNDKTITVALENQLTAMVEWHVLMSTSYSADTDTLKASAWLERRGKLIGVVSTDLEDLQTATLEVYEGDTLLKSMSTSTHDNQGVYWFTWETTGLEAGKTYFVKATISYRNSPYTSGAAVDVSSAKTNYEQKTILQGLQTQAAVIQSKVTTDIPQAITQAETSIKTDTAKILTAAETTIPTKITEAKTQITDIVKSEILNRENTVRTGQSLTIRYRTYSGLAPTLDLYDPNNVQRISKAAMKENGTTGIYEKEITFVAGWGRGDCTIVCSESTKGTLDALIITMVRSDIEQVAGQVSAILGSTTGMSDLTSVVNSLRAQFAIVEASINRATRQISAELTGTLKGALNTDSIVGQLKSMSDQIKGIGGTKGFSLEKLYEVSKEKSTDITYVKNKTQELKAMMEVNQKMIENVANKPVTQVWYEYK